MKNILRMEIALIEAERVACLSANYAVLTIVRYILLVIIHELDG